MLGEVLKNYGFSGEIVKTESGVVLNRVFFKPSPAFKIRSLNSRLEDIKRELDLESLRITTESGFIVFEMPKENPETVNFFEKFEKSNLNLPLFLGVNTSGEPVNFDLTQAPHLLIAGTTGSGKSVGINSFLVGLMKNKTPEQLKFLLIDPKRVEFSPYEDSPYLIRGVVSDMAEALEALESLVEEMESRYEILKENKVRNFESLLSKGVALPYIVCVVDEFADLILTQGRRVESAVQSLAQKARAAGIHLIIATQRPSVDVLTGVIKANFPTRLSYRVASPIDSRVILDESGAESLLGRGDSLFISAGKKAKRIQSSYISDEQLESFLEPLKIEPEPEEKAEEPEKESFIHKFFLYFLDVYEKKYCLILTVYLILLFVFFKITK